MGKRRRLDMIDTKDYKYMRTKFNTPNDGELNYQLFAEINCIAILGELQAVTDGRIEKLTNFDTNILNGAPGYNFPGSTQYVKESNRLLKKFKENWDKIQGLDIFREMYDLTFARFNGDIFDFSHLYSDQGTKYTKENVISFNILKFMELFFKDDGTLKNIHTKEFKQEMVEVSKSLNLCLNTINKRSKKPAEDD